jgi:ABC-type uncharacterized transport system fused permease/ATPase subunit
MDSSDDVRVRYQLWSSVHSIWLNLTGFANGITKYIIAGHKVFTKLIKSDQIYETFSHIGNVDDFFSWPDNNQSAIKELEPRLDRLQEFLKNENEIIIKPKKVNYVEKAKGNKLTLTNLTLSTADRELFTVKNMSFEIGGRYVISGESGSGKSSLIAKINHIIHDGIKAEGTISFPASLKKKMMLTQDDYFPAHSCLLDVICLPGKAPTSKKEREELISKAKTLLKESKIGRDLDLEQEKTNWSAELSGGQKKKIKVVSAIIQDPDLLLLDEVSVGLDHVSIKIIQKMLKKYLPKATIIAVDHHPDDSKDFYTSHHQVVKGKIEHKWSKKALDASSSSRAR